MQLGRDYRSLTLPVRPDQLGHEELATKERLLRDRHQYLSEINSLHQELRSAHLRHEDFRRVPDEPELSEPNLSSIRRRSPRRKIFQNRITTSRQVPQGGSSNPRQRSVSPLGTREIRPFLQGHEHAAGSKSIIYQEQSKEESKTVHHPHPDYLAQLCRLECCLKQICQQKESLERTIVQERESSRLAARHFQQHIDLLTQENRALNKDIALLRSQQQSSYAQQVTALRSELAAKSAELARLSIQNQRLKNAVPKRDPEIASILQQIKGVRSAVAGNQPGPVISQALDDVCRQLSSQEMRYQGQLQLLSAALAEQKHRGALAKQRRSENKERGRKALERGEQIRRQEQQLLTRVGRLVGFGS